MLAYTHIVLLAVCCVNIQCFPADVVTKPEVIPPEDKLPIKPPTSGPVKPPTDLPAVGPTALPDKTPTELPIKAPIGAIPDKAPTDALPVKEPADYTPVKAPKDVIPDGVPKDALPVKEPADSTPVKEPTVTLPTKESTSPLPNKPAKGAQPDDKTATHDVKYYVSNPNQATVDTKPSDIPNAEEINKEIAKSLREILPFLNILFNANNVGTAEDTECIDEMIIQLVPEDPKWNIHPPGKPEDH